MSSGVRYVTVRLETRRSPLMWVGKQAPAPEAGLRKGSITCDWKKGNAGGQLESHSLQAK